KELKTMTHFDITKKEDNQKNKEYMDKITNKELDNFELNKKYIKKNGEYIDVNIKVRVIKDNYGEPVYDFAFVKKR
ncbi:MAG TPA: PAS domain S-box protein, partial [Halanaerobiales bacterium]|nr:PAS domain S-box protein [Halanaerobiales bacterium]